MIYYTLTLTYIFKVKSSIFLSIFEHEYLANGLVLWNQIFVWFLPGSKTILQRKKCQLYPYGFSPGSKFNKFGGRDYLEIGKSFCCKIWSAGSHKTSNEYLRKNWNICKKWGTRENFKNLNF